jgi:hypothetical protein
MKKKHPFFIGKSYRTYKTKTLECPATVLLSTHTEQSQSFNSLLYSSVQNQLLLLTRGLNREKIHFNRETVQGLKLGHPKTRLKKLKLLGKGA